MLTDEGRRRNAIGIYEEDDDRLINLAVGFGLHLENLAYTPSRNVFPFPATKYLAKQV